MSVESKLSKNMQELSHGPLILTVDAMCQLLQVPDILTASNNEL